MSGSRLIAVGAVTLACAVCASAMAPARASAIGLGSLCNAAGLFSGLAGKACKVAKDPGRILGAGKKLLSGHLGGAAKTLLGEGGSKVGAALSLAAIGAWVLGGAKVAMDEAAKLIDHTTSPSLQSAWFSSSYWRMSGIAAVLTLPFLFAAAIQALLRSDLALLARAALGYLPLAVLAVSITAPLTMLLLAASDQMCAIVSSAAGGDGTHALVSAALKIGAVSAVDGSPFLAFLIGLFVAAGAFVLWLELLMRQAAVYIVVLMLPLAFAAMVWPSRRMWAIRAVELLFALTLSKFAIVSVLSLAAAALGHGGFTGTSAMLSGLVLVMLAAFAPWAVVRLLPLAELATGAAGSLRGEVARIGNPWTKAGSRAAATMMLGAGDSDHWPDHDPSQLTDGERAGEAARAETGRLAELPRVPGGPSVAPGWEAEDAFSPRSQGAGARSPGSQGEGEFSPGPQAEGASGAAARDAAGSEASPGAQRIPGMDERWQQEDLAWRPVTLGLDGDRPPPVLAPGEDPVGPIEPRTPLGSADGDDPGHSRDVRGEPPVSPGPDAAWPAEDHNPLPPGEEPEDGPL